MRFGTTLVQGILLSSVIASPIASPDVADAESLVIDSNNSTDTFKTEGGGKLCFGVVFVKVLQPQNVLLLQKKKV
ncbi:putative secreted protein [Wickerhamomyces ciferrii]|uniref:Secreted protein n=1 Tax=Wickerhamomyces ciferrii (strain ATCC 14091 / BCRC 22168 / CBS 111 / JCM 3599 / NBRC 0793 / NRRL Y-1031 F-60-10) TaxID=1206466 RepID=K0KYP1_WICCF|nr:uncharacterized protein BN7_6127 [Wickerhamomyces ciferrii]CCH46534.1 putative secreted protein [Wickerhamomyces ciferrii]